MIDSIWERIFVLASQKGYSIKELCEKSNLNIQSIYNAKSRGSDLTITTVCKIADILNCSLDFLIYGKELVKEKNFIDVDKEFEEFYLNMIKSVTSALSKKEYIKENWLKERQLKLNKEMINEL